MSESEPPESSGSWWRTLPGILTALAAVISAIAALIVAMNGRPAARAAESSDQPAAPRSAAAPSAAPVASPAGPGATASAATATLPAASEVTLSGGTLLLRIVDARVEPFNADTRVLRLHLRWTNNGNTFVRNYWWTLRLVVDGVPRAGEDAGYEQVDAHSARELPYAFKVPAAARRVVLAIANDSGERAELPLDLPAS